MDLGAISGSSLDINTLLTNSLNKTELSGKGYDPTNKTAIYAQKGEPMYMADMDSDEDGTVTLDEFKDYCKSKNINTREMVKMSKLASAYRTLKSENEAIDYISKLIPNVFPKVKQADSNSAFKTQSENKYNISTDADSSKKVSYKDYLEYCEQNAVPQKIQDGAKLEETNDGSIKITHTNKAVNIYKTNAANKLQNTFEEVV